MADGATETKERAGDRAAQSTNGRDSAVSRTDADRIAETIGSEGRGTVARDALQGAGGTLAETARQVGGSTATGAPGAAAEAVRLAAATPAAAGPSPPPDTAAQRDLEAAAIAAGQRAALGETAADYAAGIFEGLKNAAQAAFEAATVGMEAATGLVPDAFAARQAESLQNRIDAVAEQVKALPDLPEEVRRTYDTQIALADQLEADYRAGRADLSILQESARVRAAAQADLAVLAAETGSMVVGAGAALKGLRVARHADGDRRPADDPLAALTPRARAEVNAIAAEDIALEGRERPYTKADLDARADWQARRDAGSDFDRANADRYDFNEIYVDSGVGRSGRSRVDSFNLAGPNTGTISRKHTQLAEVSEATAMSYIDEARTKYRPGTPVANTSRNRALQINDQVLPEPLVLEVPVQARPIPQAVLDHARRNDVSIRDVEGRSYR